MLGEKDFFQSQMEIYSEIAAEHGETLKALEGVDTPEAEQQRAQLTSEVRNANLQMLQLQESARAAGRELEECGGYDFDPFGD